VCGRKSNSSHASQPNIKKSIVTKPRKVNNLITTYAN